jgi:multimeric flavodoxin WrbA
VRIVVLHGQNHQGSTWNTSQLFVDSLWQEGDEIESFTLNKVPTCIGCFNCFSKGEENCPHYAQAGSIIAAIEEADVVVLESPTYCLEMSGKMKSFVEHMGYRWYPHRPHPAMRKKIGVAISTTAGSGASSVTKSLKRQMYWWGIPKIYRLSYRVAADKWANVNEKTRETIVAQTMKAARSVRSKLGRAQPTLMQRLIFWGMKKWHKNADDDYSTDKAWWKAQGWI